MTGKSPVKKRKIDSPPPPFPMWLVMLFSTIGLGAVIILVLFLSWGGQKKNLTVIMNFHIRELSKLQHSYRKSLKTDMDFDGRGEYASTDKLVLPPPWVHKDNLLMRDNCSYRFIMSEKANDNEEHWKVIGWSRNPVMTVYQESQGIPIFCTGFKAWELNSKDLSLLVNSFTNKNTPDNPEYVEDNRGNRWVTSEKIAAKAPKSSWFIKNILPLIVMIPLIGVFIAYKIYSDRKFRKKLEKKPGERK